jgi:hypothetical protein
MATVQNIPTDVDGKFHQVVEGKAGAPQKKTWLGYFWDTADLAKDERKLLFKIDACLLIFASVRVTCA